MVHKVPFNKQWRVLLLLLCTLFGIVAFFLFPRIYSDVTLTATVLGQDILLPPMRLYGSVEVDGQSSTNSQIAAQANGQIFATATTFMENGQAVYHLDVPFDDPSTPQIDGVLPGAEIQFLIDDVAAIQRVYWDSGQIVPLDLLGFSGQRINVRLNFQSRDNVDNRSHDIPVKLYVSDASTSQAIYGTLDWVDVFPASEGNWGYASIDATTAGLTPGQQYNYTIKGAMHLAKQVTDLYQPNMLLDLTSSVFNPDNVLWACDINQDNLVDAEDFTLLSNNFGGTPSGVLGPNSEFYRSDADGSGTVNLFDYTICNINFGKFGDDLPTPSVPILISPQGPISQSNPTFTWTKVDSATGYTLVIYDVDNDEIRVSQDFGTDVCTGNCVAQFTSLNLTVGSYTWLVRAFNESGSGLWSTYSPD